METISERYASVWDAISDTPAEALDRKMRSDLMIALKKIIKAKGWTRAEAAKHLGVTQPRLSDLLRGKISLFGLDSLVNMVAAAGHTVDVKVRDAA
ncbi:transcriptional regulator [Pleomorphomonas diazotrophica]|uniref:Transcriptional regulator n=1 Tax=Pleomorphomonas diazotrophica TaxID=1166257 RepID=A0A1I4V3A6_9HYPH|nr:XRE family transcriptional regulator [Pleomorphomonas diazotrophica]PKR88724.1 transcriptional regulator [Pleomorphomonas diazotrophica]SFM95699.1 Predicted DNA-binding protein, contains XRE-type HTH domain [Pleomorphomonas diazotrophica]